MVRWMGDEDGMPMNGQRSAGRCRMECAILRVLKRERCVPWKFRAEGALSRKGLAALRPGLGGLSGRSRASDT